jgi:branched-chain amino acid transport system permease protein
LRLDHGVYGRVLQRAVLERSARGGQLVPVLNTFGLAIVIDNLLFQAYGADTRSLTPYVGSLSYDSWVPCRAASSSASWLSSPL